MRFMLRTAIAMCQRNKPEAQARSALVCTHAQSSEAAWRLVVARLVARDEMLASSIAPTSVAAPSLPESMSCAANSQPESATCSRAASHDGCSHGTALTSATVTRVCVAIPPAGPTV